MVDVSLGEQYSVIRDQLQSICKTHRKFIAESARMLCSESQGYVAMAPDSKART